MSSARLQKIFQDLRPIIEDAIAIKIESDMSDEERKVFIKIIIDAPETAVLIPTVLEKLELKSLRQRSEINQKTALIDAEQKYIDVFSKVENYGGYVDRMTQELKKNTHDLSNSVSNFMASGKRVEKSFSLFKELLQEVNTQLSDSKEESPKTQRTIGSFP